MEGRLSVDLHITGALRSSECSIWPLTDVRNSGLIVLQGAFTVYRRNLIIDQVAQHRIPAVYPIRLYPESGGLVSYGVDFADQFRQAANYADRILRGAKVVELPVQQPTKALGLKVPLHLQQLAGELIENERKRIASLEAAKQAFRAA